MRILVLAVVGFLGCSDETIGPDPDTTTSSGNSMGGDGAGANSAGLGYENGTRLVARNMVAADGASQFWGWYDSELKIECNFGKAEDGETRCLPSGPQTFEGTLGARYSDAGCTQLVVTAGPSCAPKPTHANKYDACGQNRTVYAIGDNVGTVYQGTPGDCTASGPSDSVYYEVGAKLPASGFVSAVVE
jgi:hypothetical protein